ncbi:aminotransferase class V-fold PLP-dependent enzyme [Nocardia carnea]|uniref:aminotransferase class V-fold PLP-dependent enzyme n=1 Tax=Nocardia carnea TaxID=37328 RepID=UPI002453803A|nr:aminotransferase class V-fold PLP-dependent enzyme [Nocardia carnea]
MTRNDAQEVAGPADLLATRPGDEPTDSLDLLRDTEYRYLDEGGVVYLDFAGAGLAADAQHRAHRKRLAAQCFGNPHSENPTSTAATEVVDRARHAVLSHLRADPEEYCVIFTANATAACRLVGEAYGFTRRSRFVVTADNHNSVLGIREFARARKTPITYVPLDTPDLRTSDDTVYRALHSRNYFRRTEFARRGLFAYPAQSNFTGVQHPLEWVDIAHEYGYDVLLDAAAYLPANTLDLGVVKPDFVPISWYKLFGYPTGVGCLVARRTALAALRRPWFAGGTIAAASLHGNWHVMAGDESAFEDGTLNFLSIPDITFGIGWLHDIGMDTIHRRVTALTGRLLAGLTALTHDNGAPMIRLYGPADTVRRGGTVAFNFLDPDGTVLDERLIAAESAAAGISLRTGCFCNPGAGEAAFGISLPVLRRLFGTRLATMDEYVTALGLPSGGAIRVSLGAPSNLADIETFLDFAERTYRNRAATQEGLRARERC